jgi:hypothetical protein
MPVRVMNQLANGARCRVEVIDAMDIARQAIIKMTDTNRLQMYYVWRTGDSSFTIPFKNDPRCT